jgi:pimeloyl-ACP methyl ester carboxylesterase
VERRFAPEVVAASDEAVSRLKALYSARRLRLVGYSGGGVVATLLAMQRDDVELLVTVAAPLALSEWVAWHGASPLTGSLDPAIYRSDVNLPPAMHFVGGRDRTVPALIVESFIRRRGGQIQVVSDFDHECCWARDWSDLLGHLPKQKGLK